MPDSPGWTPLTCPSMNLSAGEINAVAQAVIRLTGGTCGNAVLDGSGLHARPRRNHRPKPPGFWAQIGDNTSLGNNRWTYSWQQMEKTSTGYDGWVGVAPEVKGTDNAYNALEDMNSSTGIQGNGVDADNLDTTQYTFEMQPCPHGAIVWMREVAVTGETDPEYWFAYVNGIDGECD